MNPPFPCQEWNLHLASEADTLKFGVQLGAALHGGDVIALFGELGSGKTTMVQAIGKGMGKNPEDISSPTFVFIQEYGGHPPLAHADLYRLDSLQEYQQIGLSDYFDDTWVVAIEWADKMLQELPHDRVELHLTHHPSSTRQLQLKGLGARGAQLVGHLITHYSGDPPLPR